mgnify:CR=1 FL=1
MRHGRLALSISPTTRRPLVQRSNRARHHNLGSLKQVLLLVSLIEQLQERHDAKPHSRDIDAERLHVVIKAQCQVTVRPVLQRRILIEIAGMGTANTAVADEQVQVSDIFLDELDRLLDVVFGGDVALDGDDIGTDGRSGVLQNVEAASGNVDFSCAVVCERLCEHQANSYHDISLEPLQCGEGNEVTDLCRRR